MKKEPKEGRTQYVLKYARGVTKHLDHIYEVDEQEREVQILAIGEKKGNRLFVGGKDVTT